MSARTRTSRRPGARRLPPTAGRHRRSGPRVRPDRAGGQRRAGLRTVPQGLPQRGVVTSGVGLGERRDAGTLPGDRAPRASAGRSGRVRRRCCGGWAIRLRSRGVEAFPRGTLRPDGRLDLCKQGLGPVAVTRGARRRGGVAAPAHLLLGTNGLGADGVDRRSPTRSAGGHRIQTVYLGCNHIDATGRRARRRLADDADRAGAVAQAQPDRRRRASPRSRAALRTNATHTDAGPVQHRGDRGTGCDQLADALAARPRPVERLFLGGNGLGPSAAPVLARFVATAGVTRAVPGGQPPRRRGRGPRWRPRSAGSTDRSVWAPGGNGLSPAGVAALAARLHLVRAGSTWPGRRRSACWARVSNVVGDRGAAALAAALPGQPGCAGSTCATPASPAGARRRCWPRWTATRRWSYLGLGPGVPRRMQAGGVDPVAPGRARAPRHRGDRERVPVIAPAGAVTGDVVAHPPFRRAAGDDRRGDRGAAGRGLGRRLRGRARGGRHRPRRGGPRARCRRRRRPRRGPRPLRARPAALAPAAAHERTHRRQPVRPHRPHADDGPGRSVAPCGAADGHDGVAGPATARGEPGPAGEGLLPRRAAVPVGRAAGARPADRLGRFRGPAPVPERGRHSRRGPGARFGHRRGRVDRAACWR